MEYRWSDCLQRNGQVCYLIADSLGLLRQKANPVERIRLEMEPLEVIMSPILQRFEWQLCELRDLRVL